MSARRVTAATWLIALSAVALLGGLYFPLAVLADPGPSAWAYGIVMVSFPAWAVGGATGALAGWLEGRVDAPDTRQRRIGWALAGLNLFAIVACALWNPPGIS